MIQIICDVSGGKHTELINWLYTKCDKFTFVIPNFSKTVDFSMSANTSTGTEHFYNECSKEEKQEFMKYKNKVNDIIAPINKDIIKRLFDTDYCGFESDYENEIIVAKLNNTTKNFLIKTNNLCCWTFPNMPEDVCFFSNGKCFMRTVAHERLMFIYDDSKETKQALKKMGVKFFVDINEPVPLLP